MEFSFVLFAFILVFTVIHLVEAHGRLKLPPGRASAWRYGFDTPINYNDNELYCGGFQHQWGNNGGRCGVCGDPYDQVAPRDHETGGRIATGTIVASYQQAQVIDIEVEITANHLGYFEFRLCAHNNDRNPATHDCFDKNVLEVADGLGTRFPIAKDMFLTTLQLQLPRDVTCTQCILQWKWNTGNSWGRDPVTGVSGMGYGAQEQFYGCADIAISPTVFPETTTRAPSGNTPISTATEYQTTPEESQTTSSTAAEATTIISTTPVSMLPTDSSTHQTESPTPVATTSTTYKPTQTPPRSTLSIIASTPAAVSSTQPHNLSCKGAGVWATHAGMSDWCTVNCNRGLCPKSHCVC